MPDTCKFAVFSSLKPDPAGIRSTFSSKNPDTDKRFCFLFFLQYSKDNQNNILYIHIH